MDLANVHGLCIDEIRSNLAFLSGGYPMRDAGGHVEELSRLFQALGICHLLESLDVREFQQNLVRSGHARRYCLRTSDREHDTTTKYLALSRTEAFLDVLAAGDMALARSIAELSTQTWDRNREYEDDFCFYFFLQQLTLQSAPDDGEHILRRFESALKGSSSPRLDVLQALHGKDSDKFESSLSKLLEEEQTRIDNQRAKVVDSKFLFWPRSFISIEGLALLQMAGLVGLSIEGEFPRCPQEARRPLAENDYHDLFAELAELVGH
jgi:hypothetical protein